MLQTLAEAGLPVPAVHYADDRLLVMDHVRSDGRWDGAAQAVAADALASLHDVQADRFGLDRDTVIGPLPQPNLWAADWPDFFAEHRLLHTVTLARDEGAVDQDLAALVERLSARLDRFLPKDTVPGLIHGDAWGGNLLAGRDGEVRFIDPAIYYADPEVELAYGTLFGTFGEAFFARYAEHRPLKAGFFEARRDLYNLYPLLFHARLFGGGYADQARKIAERFA